ncbi:13155_t:CDS:2, partial [Funneliformis geosporum]
ILVREVDTQIRGATLELEMNKINDKKLILNVEGVKNSVEEFTVCEGGNADLREEEVLEEQELFKFSSKVNIKFSLK